MTKIGAATIEYNGIELAMAAGGIEITTQNKPLKHIDFKQDVGIYIADSWSSMSFPDDKTIRKLRPGDLVCWGLQHWGKTYYRVARRDFKRNKIWVRRDWDYVDK